ncbi:hypothetical protein M409DRAFT_70094 [Zasmidium cellare ATCC 36951]|uniref:Autophagy-related protein n=1 Tax=Zasmidium cellare ATCC 36951 TaxID=1080233 RepID=A0A6A6C228_ZASCE|nr:uncharacterized protein M409DRAFT_70094 [Zasmidium cellare ATCC 36951]KAF2161025.1 hypothetical protein M409DRAFT_70094 [Zasmidium cellare ATCC 36951]
MATNMDLNPVSSVAFGKTEVGVHGQAGFATVEQGNTIPTSGERKTTTRLEYWAFCLYNWAGTGVGVGNYAGALQQSLTELAFPSGYLNWGGQRTSVNSFILDISGITFAVQLVVLLMTGPYADYGSWRPWILIFWTVVAVASSFAFFGFTQPSTWALASGFYILGNVALTATGAFYLAAFPNLVRDLPKMQESERQVLQGAKSPEAHADLETMERSKISNISFIFSGFGSCVSIALAFAISYGIGYQTQEQDNKVYAITIGYFGILWIVTSVPWFLVEQYRPGQKLPPGTNWLTVGPKQVWEAAKNVTHLKQTFIYIAAYFLINDSINTSGTVVNILQNNAIEFDTVTYSGLFCVVYGTVFIGLFGNMWIQKFFNISPRWMYFWNSAAGVFISLWGVVGIWTHKIGYHNVWEFWFYQAWTGGASAGVQSYAATVMAEVSPAPKMYIFFALFNTLGKTSGFIGPYIVSAIANDAHGNNNVGFYFTFFTGLVGLILLLFLDTDKAKEDNAKYLEKEPYIV